MYIYTYIICTCTCVFCMIDYPSFQVAQFTKLFVSEPSPWHRDKLSSGKAWMRCTQEEEFEAPRATCSLRIGWLKASYLKGKKTWVYTNYGHLGTWWEPTWFWGTIFSEKLTVSFRLKISQQSQSIDLSVEQLDSARNVDLAWLKHQKKGDCASNGHDSFAKRWGNSSQYLAMLRGTSWRMLMEPAKMRRFTKDFGNLTQEGCWVWSYYVVQRWPSHPQATSFDPLSKLCGKHWPLFKGGFKMVQGVERELEGTIFLALHLAATNFSWRNPNVVLTPMVTALW